ncbi:hypothetical protein [Marinomonas sp. IMCC 4694]|nr:hypothetical protein [Marinomonas sp. IMCC 4694]
MCTASCSAPVSCLEADAVAGRAGCLNPDRLEIGHVKMAKEEQLKAA